MRVLVAPNSFKGSLRSAQIAEALGVGLRRAGHDVASLPVADGGDGTVEAALAAGFRAAEVDTVGPRREPQRATWAFDGETAVVEVASTCGLTLVSDPVGRALDASSLGFGIAVRDALERRPQRLVLALGGSASTDGGLGLLEALGAVARDAAGKRVSPNGHGVIEAASIEWTDPLREPLRSVDLVVATDVDSPLFGPQGAACVFGPQKGARPAEVRLLDAALERWATVCGRPDLAEIPGAGAAGGLGFAGLVLGGRIVSGADYLLDLVGFADAVRWADVVVTGEGRLDDQTVRGKLPAVVARRAGGRPVHFVVGSDTATDRDSVAQMVASVRSLDEMTEADPREAPELTRHLLTQAGADLGASLAEST